VSVAAYVLVDGGLTHGFQKHRPDSGFARIRTCNLADHPAIAGGAMNTPYQQNEGGIVALLPDGRVEFLHPAALPLLEAARAGDAKLPDIDDNILSSPLVRLEQFHLTAPAIAFIELTNLCNLRCKHCYTWSGPKRPNEMTTEKIIGLLDQFAESGVLQVFLTGGEIFAHPDAIEIINYARTKPFSTQIFTNGLLITEEALARITPGTSFFISFDTADPERTVRGKMDFPKLRSAFEWMKTHGHAFRTAISVHRNNVADAEEIFEWCAINDYPQPQWLETRPVGRALLHPGILLQPDQIDEVFEVYRRCMDRSSAAPEAEEVGGVASAVALRSVDTIKFCQRLERATGQEKCGRSLVYVNSVGDVFPCSNCMSGGLYRAGSVVDQPFAEIWANGFDEFRCITFDDHNGCQECPVHNAGIWCQFRCPPLAQNVSRNQKGCGATEYLRLFMLRAGAFWEERRKAGVRLTMAPSRPHRAEHTVA